MYVYIFLTLLFFCAHVSVSLCCSTVASNISNTYYRNPTTKAKTIPVEKAEVERRET